MTALSPFRYGWRSPSVTTASRILDSGTGTRFGGTANLEAFTETRWVTIRAGIAPYPF